ncbi:XrtA system polysaccharide chain length determinant [Aquabacterium sp.]|uniref:XrtA system polysaccharide chain length determinant n=1 Tax=Aquabacterium sp. TaxID=1872578 RepID=UPI0025BA6D10|nr:XrtA system polysaccharide chain length determinant [Aquabacterium sp.]
MDDIVRQLTSILLAVWRRRWLALGVAWLVFLAAVGLVWLKHDRYEASARVFVDTETVLKPLMTGLAFQPDVDQQVKMLARTLISRPNIEQLVQSPRVGLTHLSESDREKVIERLMRDIKMAPSGDAKLFALSYADINPDRAQRIVEELVALFVNSGVIDKQRDSEQARQFLDDQIKSYESKLTEAENKLKDFKIRNFGLTGTSNTDYFSRMSESTTELNRIRVELQAAEQAREALKRELAAEDPSMPSNALPGAPALPTETEARLDAQRRQLDDLMRRYTDEHPDVLAVKRNIAQLEQQRRAEAEQAGRSKDRGKAPTSPVFQRIRMAQAEAEAKVASLRGQLGAQQAQLDQARSMAGKAPAVEAELAQLNRDYDIVRKNYEQLVARRESASLGVKIDQTTKAAEFRVVEPPRVSDSATKPSRLMIALLGFIAAIGGGFAAAFGLSQVLPTVQTTRQLSELTGRPTLGSVAMVSTPADLEDAQKQLRLFMAVSTLFILANIGWIVVVKLKLIP